MRQTRAGGDAPSLATQAWQRCASLGNPALATKPAKTTEQQCQIGYNQRVPDFPTILVFDSGLGGLTVLREIVRARLDAHYVYVADDAFFPYGHHGEDEIIARVVPLVGELIAAHSPDLAVIACNTASTLVMAHLRSAYTAPFVGTVPAIKPACANSRTK